MKGRLSRPRMAATSGYLADNSSQARSCAAGRSLATHIATDSASLTAVFCSRFWSRGSIVALRAMEGADNVSWGGIVAGCRARVDTACGAPTGTHDAKQSAKRRIGRTSTNQRWRGRKPNMRCAPLGGKGIEGHPAYRSFRTSSPPFEARRQRMEDHDRQQCVRN